MYLRARLALAGLTDVDEADTSDQAGMCVARRQYDVAIVSLDLPDADSWAVVEAFKTMPFPPRAVVVATEKPSWLAMERAEALGCVGLLDVPFSPPQVVGILQKV